MRPLNASLLSSLDAHKTLYRLKELLYSLNELLTSLNGLLIGLNRLLRLQNGFLFCVLRTVTILRKISPIISGIS
jgi:hypothetical protein